MGKTKHSFKGKDYPAKTRKKRKDVKSFGYTSGLHSQFEAAKARVLKEYDESNPITDPFHEIKKRNWEMIKDKTYPEKNIDYVKYGYGNGSKKKVKNHQKEIE